MQVQVSHQNHETLSLLERVWYLQVLEIPYGLPLMDLRWEHHDPPLQKITFIISRKDVANITSLYAYAVNLSSEDGTFLSVEKPLTYRYKFSAFVEDFFYESIASEEKAVDDFYYQGLCANETSLDAEDTFNEDIDFYLDNSHEDVELNDRCR